MAMVSWFYHHQKIILLPLLPLGFFGLAFFAHAAVTVSAPTSSSNWTAGTANTILWSGGGVCAVDINLADSFGNDIVTLFAQTANDGSQSWLVPMTIPTGQYRINIIDGCDSTNSLSATFTITNPDIIFPSVSVISPANGSAVSGSITVSASASDTGGSGIAGVQFKVDGSNIGAEDTSSPYSISFDTRTVANGSHTLTAVARDGANNTTTSAPVGITTGNAWLFAADTLQKIDDGGALVSVGNGNNLYAFRGGNKTEFYRYSISGNSWSTVVPSSGSISGISAGGALAYAGGDYIYALRGGNNTTFYRYSISGNSWTTMTAAPGNISSGGALAYPGTGDYLYAFQGGSTAFYRYSISGNSWTTLTSAIANIGAGGALAYPGTGNYLYAFRGGNNQDFYRYFDIVLFNDTMPPSVPAGLSAIAASPSQINLSWTASTDNSGIVAGYNIYRCAGAGCTPTAAVGTSAANSFSDTGLNSLTTYGYAVSAYDAVPNTSANSSSAYASTPAALPPTVATNAASGITTTSATLNGSADPNGFATTGWFRYSATNPGSCSDSFGTRLPAAGGAALGAGSSPAAYSNPVSGLTSGTTYYYCAIASNSIGMDFGSVVSFFVPLPAAPAFPTPLTANPATVVSGGPFTLTWASSGAVSCSASANPANSQWDDIPAAPPLSGSQAMTNLTVSTTFTITCTNAGGSTLNSATVTVTPPPNVSGHAWAGSGVGANDAEINANPGIGWLKMSGTASDSSPYGVLVAADGTMSGYAWVNPNDADAGTNNIGWIDFAPAGPYPVSSFVPAQSVRLDRATGAVTGWARACGVFASACSGALRAASELGGWDGWIGFGSGGNYTQPVSVSGCAWSGYAWGGGVNIGWIQFNGTAIDGNPYGVIGSGNACATIANIPDDPSGLSADAGIGASCNAMVITWTDNAANEDYFELERKRSSDPDTAYVKIAEPGADSVSFTDTGAVGGLLRDTSYTYRIRACNASGCGAYSNADSANNQNPLPAFTWTPPSPLKNANTTFNAVTSAVYGGASIAEYFWTFADGVPATSCSSAAGSGCDNPPLTSLASSRFQFPPLPAQKSVTLRVTDSNIPARQCSVTQAVPVRSGSASPPWIEVSPE